MYEFSAGDGFVELNESLGEMIKYIANEPSVGLYYIQQHAQHAVPNVVGLRNNIVENSRETLLQAEDLEDSITMVRSMKECGCPIADEMIGEIKRSLAIMSTKQPIRGLIQRSNSSFQIGGMPSSWSPSIWSARRDGERRMMGSYLSSVLHKAGNFKWPQIDLMELQEIKVEDLGAYQDESLSTLPDEEEVEELPLSSQIVDDEDDHEEEEEEDAKAPTDCKLKSHHASSSRSSRSRSDNYDEFKADREARLEAWLEDGKESR
ncbi:hypothetical protein Dimus_011520 [Dionaea muscipula]